MVQRYTLKNGVPIFIVESDASPVVSIQAWVSRGSAHETEREAGISHFLEHALFKGTRKRKVGEIALTIERCGGEINAFTSFEETVYYTTLASRYFEEGLDVITDAIQHPLFDREEMAREREVILEEIKRAHDSATKTVFTNLWGMAFKGTPYGRPVLGYEKTVSRIDSTTLRRYFDKNYHAGSIALFIVGDVDAARALRAAETRLKKMRPGKPAKKNPFRAGPVPKTAVAAAAKDIKECHAYIGFRAPQLTDAIVPSLDLLCSAIGQGESSRLYQRLVKQERIALDAEMALICTDACGMATLGISAAPENLYKAVASAFAIFEEVARDGVAEHEIDRVKSAMESEVVYGKQTVDGYAKRLGYYHRHFGDPEFEKSYLDDVLEVSPRELQNALGRITAEKPIFSLVHPQAFELDKKRLAGAYKKPKVALPKKAARALPERIVGKGATFVVKKSSALPLTSLRMVFLGGGSREETSENFGIANLFQSLWTSGTKSFTSLDIAHRLESLAASISSFAGKNTCGLSVDFLTKDWHHVKPLLKEILLEPTFPENELETERQLALREILSQRDMPANLCQLQFMETLYGDHPYGRSGLGTEKTVKAVTRESLAGWYRDFVHRGKLVVSTVGRFRKEEWIEELEELCAELPTSGRTSRGPIPFKRPERLTIVSAQKQPLFQSHILIGFPGATIASEDRFALRLLSSCLAGQGGRLFLELRDRQSLAYTVAPMNSESLEAGVFAFYIGCSPEKLGRSIGGIRAEIEKILAKPLGAQELARAKQYLVGRFELDMQRNSSQAMLFALDEVYGLGYDHALSYPDKIRQVTANDVLAAARKYLQLDRAVISVVHPTPLRSEEIESAWTGKPAASPVRTSARAAEASA